MKQLKLQAGQTESTVQIDFSRFHNFPSIPGHTINYQMGKGGMSSVYLAEDVEGKQVALKVSPNYSRQMRADLSHLDDWFMRECAATMSISHQNVVHAKKWGETEDHIFLSLEALSGNTLQFFLSMGRKLQWKDAKKLFIDVCKGLKAIHEGGIVHRDLKPENIFLNGGFPTYEGKIIDLGLCFMNGYGQIRQPPDESVVRVRDIALSSAGTLFGTPEYMPPESGIERLNRNPAFDIYSLGMTIYEAVCGDLPFNKLENLDQQVRVASILQLKRNFYFPRPREINPKLKIPKAAEDAIMKAIEIEPHKRFVSAEEMGRAIEFC